MALTIQWDTQHDSPNQSTFAAVPYTRLTRRAYLTTAAAVRERFIPLWRYMLLALRKVGGASSFLRVGWWALGLDAAADGACIMYVVSLGTSVQTCSLLFGAPHPPAHLPSGQLHQRGRRLCRDRRRVCRHVAVLPGGNMKA